LCRRKQQKTSQRGYGCAYQAESVAKLVATGQAVCARCGYFIHPGDAWDLDHKDSRDGDLGPSHARCNRATNKGKSRRSDWSELKVIGLEDDLEPLNSAAIRNGRRANGERRREPVFLSRSS
jgi:hypothetical protein